MYVNQLGMTGKRTLHCSTLIHEDHGVGICLANVESDMRTKAQKITLAVCYLMVTQTPVFAQETFNTPQYKNDPFLQIYDPNEAYSGIEPPASSADTFSFQDTGTHLWMFEDHEYDCFQEIHKCSFYHSPLFYFKEDPRTPGYPWVSLDTQYEDFSVLKMRMILRNDQVLSDAKKHLRNKYQRFYHRNNKPIKDQQINFLPITEFMIRPEISFLPSKYKDFLYAKYPDRFFPYSIKSIAEDEIEIYFQVPKNEERYIMDRFRKGVTFNIHFNYLRKEIAINRSNSSMEVNIDQKLIRDFSGGREKILATKDQIMSLLTEVTNEVYEHKYIEDQTALTVFKNLEDRFFNVLLNTTTTLGDALGEYVSLYKLKEDDTLVTPNYTTIDHTRSKDKTESYQKLKYIANKSSSKEKGGGGGFKLFSLNGKVVKSSTSNVTDEKEYKDIHEIEKEETWEGMEIDPFEIKLYEVYTSNLTQTFRVDATVVLAGPTNVTQLSIQRNSATHLAR